MKKNSLMHKMLGEFIICTIVILVLATPLFYWLTKNFYAEDMLSLLEAVQQGAPIPADDLKEDVLEGLMMQFVLICGVLGVSLILTVRFISHRLWKPFDRTLQALEAFRLEEEVVPELADSGIREFDHLNAILKQQMASSIRSYRTQKEFTENASHELQTPLAVFQGKLDLLLQQPDLTEQQVDAIQSLYRMTRRLTQLNRNLLLLARIDNKQYKQWHTVDVVTLLEELLPSLQTLAGDIRLYQDFRTPSLEVKGSHVLLESLVNNLVVNAVRHNTPEGEITLSVDGRTLVVANTSPESALDPRLIFSRFYRPSERVNGNGLGLAIVKAICDYHGWRVEYVYREGRHHFCVTF